MLTVRQKLILKIIILKYQESGEPVGSETISKTVIGGKAIPYSSATIRNDCLVLENQGYLEKTHSSSGRIPATKGYRLYVDELIEPGDEITVSALIEKRVKDIFNKRDLAINEVVMQTSVIISEMTKLISIVVGPNSVEDKLKKIELVPLNETAALAIIITNNGHVENKTFNILKVPLKDLEIATSFFNKHLVGTKISLIKEKLEILTPFLAQQVQKSEYIIQSFVNALVKFSKPVAVTHGIRYMLEKPEFSDINKLKTLIDFIEKQSPWTYFEKDDLKNQIQIKIGEEITSENNDMAMLTTSFELKNHETGQIMVIGPKRLEYEKIREILSWVSQAIKEQFG